MIKSLLSYTFAKNYRKRSIFEKVMVKIKRCSFFAPQCSSLLGRLLKLITVIICINNYSAYLPEDGGAVAYRGGAFEQVGNGRLIIVTISEPLAATQQWVETSVVSSWTHSRPRRRCILSPRDDSGTEDVRAGFILGTSGGKVSPPKISNPPLIICRA